MSNRNTKDMPRIPISVAKLNMLQRLRFANEYFFTLAEREREKGDRADFTSSVKCFSAVLYGSEGRAV